MLTQITNKLLLKQNLNESESYNLASYIFREANDVEITSFLTLLASRDYAVDEIIGFVKFLQQHKINFQVIDKVLDIVGTGGDHSNSLNISTASALLAAKCGVKVVKHGNRASTSKCGSADVLEALGFNLNQSIDSLTNDLAQHNFAFCFAPVFNPLLARVRDVRKKLSFPTIFNILGPLLNPASVEYMMIGVYNEKLVELVSHSLIRLGCKRALVYCANGMDEITTLGVINAKLVDNGKTSDLVINPTKLGFNLSTLDDLRGFDKHYNAKIISHTLCGVKTGLTDTIVLNVALALLVYGITNNIEDGIDLAIKRLTDKNILPQNRLLDIINRKVQKPRIIKSFKQAILSKSKGAVISEIKRASPSMGKIANISDPVSRALSYVNAGAACVSVLTDEGFEGGFDDLKQVSSALSDTSAAILCKDFFFSLEQVAKAHENGADAILVMVSVLQSDTKRMVDYAHMFGLEALVEVHTPEELPIALASGGDVIGINQRDLRDFSMHPEIFSELINQVPDSVVLVAESGIENADDAIKSFNMGFDAVLVGTALSKLDNINEFFDKVR